MVNKARPPLEVHTRWHNELAAATEAVTRAGEALERARETLKATVRDAFDAGLPAPLMLDATKPVITSVTRLYQIKRGVDGHGNPMKT